MLSLDCLSEMVANSNIDLFDNLLNTHNNNEKIGNLYKYINNIDYNYKAKSIFIQMLVPRTTIRLFAVYSMLGMLWVH